MLFTLLDPSTLCGQLVQALLQVLLWKRIFKFTKSYAKGSFCSRSWYIEACKKGDGEPEFLMTLCAIPQHTVSCFFVFLGYYFSSLQLFTMGTLGEFSFEFIELFDLCMAKYVYKNCAFSDAMFKAMICHHVPGVLVIIPTNLYFGDNVYIQKIAFSLLAVAPTLAVFGALYKTRNVYDLQQRGQFTVYSVLHILTLLWFRFYWTPSLMIDFIAHGFFSFSMLSQFMFVFYGVLINLFNVLCALVLLRRLYGFLYGHKCVNKPSSSKVKFAKIAKAPCLRFKVTTKRVGVSPAISLKRARSTPFSYKRIR